MPAGPRVPEAVRARTRTVLSAVWTSMRSRPPCDAWTRTASRSQVRTVASPAWLESTSCQPRVTSTVWSELGESVSGPPGRACTGACGLAGAAWPAAAGTAASSSAHTAIDRLRDMGIRLLR